ncbi:MAG: hypothetical protein M9898_05320 [Chitinophagaceae bacterium]|nr:hypothetical protein [Chitinophagaceae bacterium]
MKRLFLPVFLSLTMSAVMGQSLKKATKYFDGKDYDKAKTEVDALLEKNPTDGEAIYLKSKIYGKIADSAALKSLVQGDARAEAFEAFKKAFADSANMKVRLAMMKDNFQGVFDMYGGYYQDAVDYFNKGAQSQNPADFAAAMTEFMKAEKIGQYIRSIDLAPIGVVDTTLALNIGKAALNAKKDDITMEYFKKIADSKIKGPHNSDDDGFKLPYQWLEYHYKEAGDEANMLKYGNLGKELFPDEDYYSFVMIDYYREKKQLPKMLAVYGDLVKAHPDSLKYHFSYANEIFGYIYNSDEGEVIENRDEWMKTMKSELDKSMELDPNDVNNNWLSSQYYFNQGVETHDKAVKTKDAAEKASLNAAATNFFKESIPFADKALKTLEASGTKEDKSRYKSIVNLMQNIYQSLGDKDNLKKYQDMYDAADALFKSKS